MTTEHLELLQRLEAWSPDAPDAAFSFSQRLARDNAWSLLYAQRVMREYKRFAFLAVAAGHPVTPSDQVDQAWHLHLLYTQSYWKEFCPEILRTPLHHGPTKGGASERDKFNGWYARTLASYHAFFGGEPPSDIWPAPVQRFGGDIHFARVNTARNWVVPKPAWMRKAACVLSAARRRIPSLWKWKTSNCVARLASRWFGVPALAGPVPALNSPPASPEAVTPDGNPKQHCRLVMEATALIAALVLAGCTGDGDFRSVPGWPFDLTAGPFLLFFLVTWAAIARYAAWLRRRARLPVEAPDEPLPKLDAYDTAFLAGGRNRALFAAVAHLTHRGALEIDEKEHRLRREVLRDAAHPFEASIHQNVAIHPGSTFKEISDQCPVLPECARIEEKLKELGLLTTELQRGNVCFIPMLIALIVPAIGFIKIVIGVSRDKPVGILVVLSLISLAVALAFAIRPHRTRRGDAVLTRLREKYAELESPAQPGESSLALLALPLAVGLFGPSVLNGTALAEIEKKLQANTGGSAGGGCGGGCGGGGCGGGCGGCGGCGG